jgi:hypothetical protein
MSKHTLFGSIVSTSVCAICSILALSPVFAAYFPVGSYKAQDLSLVFDDQGQFHVDNGGTSEVSGTYSVEQGRVELCRAGRRTLPGQATLDLLPA